MSLGDKNLGKPEKHGTPMAETFNGGRGAVATLGAPASRGTSNNAQRIAAKHDKRRHDGTWSRRDFV